MKRILIVEDDFYIRYLYTQSFLNAGYEVEEAEDGDHALTLAKTKNYDVIILDIMLPKVNGLDVLKAIRTFPHSSKTPIFVTTNLDQGNTTQQALRGGAVKCLLKVNFEPKEIVKEIDDYLTGQSKDSSAPQNQKKEV